MKKAFANCSVSNGVLRLGTSSQEELNKVYQKFSQDLLNYDIPHWRVVGFYFPRNSNLNESAFADHDVLGMSLIEFGRKVSCVIPTTIGGNNPLEGCFYGKNEELNLPEKVPEDFKGFNQTFGIQRKDNGGKFANILVDTTTKEIGSLMFDKDDDKSSAGMVSEITCDKLSWTKFGLYETVKPTLLLPNEKLCDVTCAAGMNTATFLFIKRGTGIRSYEDNQNLFDSSHNRLMPCKTVYDLSKYFLCKYPMSGTNELQLVYLADINEDALTTILRDYGGEFE